MEEADSRQKFQQVKENVMSSEGYLHIKRVPKNTVSSFIEFANDEKEFNRDWGMAFKVVWDFYRGMNPRTNEAMMIFVDQNTQRINELEKKFDKVLEVKKDTAVYKTMADGSKRLIRK